MNLQSTSDLTDNFVYIHPSAFKEIEPENKVYKVAIVSLKLLASTFLVLGSVICGMSMILGALSFVGVLTTSPAFCLLTSPAIHHIFITSLKVATVSTAVGITSALLAGGGLYTISKLF